MFNILYDLLVIRKKFLITFDFTINSAFNSVFEKKFLIFFDLKIIKIFLLALFMRTAIQKWYFFYAIDPNINMRHVRKNQQFQKTQ